MVAECTDQSTDDPRHDDQTKSHALLVTSDEMAGQFPDHVFARLGCCVAVAHSVTEAKALADAQDFDLALLPLQVNNRSTLWLIEELLNKTSNLGVVVVSQNDQIDDAAEAMRLGAEDCIFLPFTEKRLHKTVSGVLQKVLGQNAVRPRRDVRRTAHPHAPAIQPPTHEKRPTPIPETRRGLIFSDPSTQPVIRALNSVRTTGAPVFITGESGTGKERLARVIHAEGPHAHGPFTLLDCPRLTIERLADTFSKDHFPQKDTVDDRLPVMTVYLDRITECSLDVQRRLLSLLNTVKDTSQRELDDPRGGHRFICSCSEDITAAIKSGSFLKELYYRLNVVPIHLPALRARGADIAAIATTWVTELSQRNGRRYRSLSVEATQRLSEHHWPGNIRQLVNVIRNVVLHHDGPQVTHDMLPANLLSEHHQQPAADGASSQASLDTLIGRPLAEIERLIIERTIEMQNGSVTQAAKVLGVSPSTLYRKRDAWDRE
ncbi:sigma-54-dependent transcriptional regulator [Aliiroseovarius sp. 2305UL8-7]|uniref:sigma-54-dependent transcriptional regulator n=1 Tax=Aliiroseovarius conchicola TaxID=3121637 RepID=UPI003526F5C0